MKKDKKKRAGQKKESDDKKAGTFETLAKLAEALEVEPYELLLPKNAAVNFDSRKTKLLMKQLRRNVAETMDTIENFLASD